MWEDGEDPERTSSLLAPGVGRHPGKTGLEGQSKGGKGCGGPGHRTAGPRCVGPRIIHRLWVRPQARVGNSEASVFGPQFHPESSWHRRPGMRRGDVRTELT